MSYISYWKMELFQILTKLYDLSVQLVAAFPDPALMGSPVLNAGRNAMCEPYCISCLPRCADMS